MASNPHQAFCSVCQVQLKATKAKIKRHSQTTKHLDCLKSKGVVTELPKYFKSVTNSQQKIDELKLSVFVAEHSSLSSIDHLGTFLSTNFPDSASLANLQLHRKKCTKLITQVIAPCLHQEIVNDVLSSESFYSLILDESTDASTEKTLGIIIRYFSEILQTVVTTLYCLVSIDKGDADTQVEAILEQLKADKLPLPQMVGIGVDGANVNVGAHHSIASLLRKQVPHLVVFKCICHSLHLASSKAMDLMPRNLEFLIKETASWFTCSTKRQTDYKALYQTLCDGETPLKIGKPADTREKSNNYLLLLKLSR